MCLWRIARLTSRTFSSRPFLPNGRDWSSDPVCGREVENPTGTDGFNARLRVCRGTYTAMLARPAVNPLAREREDGHTGPPTGAARTCSFGHAPSLASASLRIHWNSREDAAQLRIVPAIPRTSDVCSR